MNLDAPFTPGDALAVEYIATGAKSPPFGLLYRCPVCLAWLFTSNTDPAARPVVDCLLDGHRVEFRR